MNDQTSSQASKQPSNDPQGVPTSVSRPFSILPSAGSPARQAAPTSLTSLVLAEQGIARLLGRLVEDSGLTFKQLADLLGVKYQTVQAFVTGRNGNPSLKTTVRLLEACGARIIVEFPKRSI